VICARCAEPLEPLPTEGGANPTVVLTVGSKPLPLRCVGCGKLVCHVCQTDNAEDVEGMTAAHVSLVCTFCGDGLEMVRGALPSTASADDPPMTEERRRELTRAYQEQQRAAPAERRVSPGLQRLLDQALGPAPAAGRQRGRVRPSVAGGCLVLLAGLLFALAGYNLNDDGSYAGLFVAGVIGLIAGGIVEFVIDWICDVFRRRG